MKMTLFSTYFKEFERTLLDNSPPPCYRAKNITHNQDIMNLYDIQNNTKNVFWPQRYL